MATITATLIATDASDALARISRHADKAGVSPTGRVSVHSARHALWNVELDVHGDRDNAWVVLTSYGISPSADLGSRWERVEAGWIEATA